MANWWRMPTWDECEAVPANERDGLQKFIYENTPAGKDEAEFREQLQEAIWCGHQSINAYQSKTPGNAK